MLLLEHTLPRAFERGIRPLENTGGAVERRIARTSGTDALRAWGVKSRARKECLPIASRCGGRWAA
jgi:hypothetical protein